MSSLWTVLIVSVLPPTSLIADYTCPQGQSCVHECTETSACSTNPYTIQCRSSQPCTIKCTGTNVCSNTFINCPDIADCTVQCVGTNACVGATIAAAADGQNNVECNGQSACSGATFNFAANTVGSNMVCEALNGCYGAIIYWPSDNTVPRSIRCDSSVNINSCSGITHYNSITTKPTAAITTTATATTALNPTTTSIITTTTTYPSVSPTTTIPTRFPTISPTTPNPTSNPGILHSEVAVLIEFEFTYNSNDSIVDIEQLLTNTTTSIINEGIDTLNIDCCSSDYMVNIQIINENTAKINATVLICNATEADKLAAYFINIVGKNNVIETKYEENNDIIDLIPDTTTIVAISNEIIKPETIEHITSTTEKPATTLFAKYDHDDNTSETDQDATIIIIFSTLSSVFCAIIIIALIILYRRNNSNDGLEFPVQPERVGSTMDSPTETKQSTDLNTDNIFGDKGENDHDDDDEDEDIYGSDELISNQTKKTTCEDDPKRMTITGSEIVIAGHSPVMTPRNEPGSIKQDGINDDNDSDIYQDPGSPSFRTHGFIMDAGTTPILGGKKESNGAQIINVGTELTDLELDAIQ